MATVPSSVDISRERLELSKNNVMLDDIHFSMPKRFSEALDCCDIAWLRPVAIIEEPAVYNFDTGSGKPIQIHRKEPRFDWFMVPLATLCMFPHTVYNLLSAKEDFNKSYAGMFKARFHNGGKWKDIVIDDRLPFHSCADEHTPYFVATDGGYWLPLLLKAFAKFHGSYDKLMSGCIEEAYQAFTSGVTETVQLDELKPKFHISLIKYFESACILTLKYDYKENGVIHTSYFTIIDMKHAGTETAAKPSDVILKLKYVFSLPKGLNVFDAVPCQKLMKLLMNLNGRDNLDGAYWMSYKDLITTFSILYVCNLDWGMGSLVRQPKVKLEAYKFNGAWFSLANTTHSLHDPGSIPFWSFPQFKFELREPDTYRNDTRCEFLVSLQQPAHLYNPSVELIGFFIFRLVNELERIPVEFKFFSMYRPLTQVIDKGSVIRRRLKLPVGAYLIIPVAEPENHNDFYLRVFTEAKYNVWGHVPRNVNVPSVEKKGTSTPSNYLGSKRVSRDLSLTPTPSQIMMQASLAYQEVDKK